MGQSKKKSLSVIERKILNRGRKGTPEGGPRAIVEKEKKGNKATRFW